MFLSIARVTKFALQNFLRNIWLSIVTITIIALTFLSLTSLIIINVVTDQAIGSVKGKFDISLTFKPEIPLSRVDEVRDELRDIPYISSATVITPEDTLDQFRTKHAQDPSIISALNALTENPFGATLTIRPVSLDYYQTLNKRIEEMGLFAEIERVDSGSYERIVNRLENISGRIQTTSFVISGFFAFIALLIVFNAIRMGIYSHRDEITIMRLVGATNGFIRGPFLIETFLYTTIACALFWIIFLAVIAGINPQLNNFFGEIGFDLRGYLMLNIWNIIGFELVLMLVLTSISSVIAMAKYLRV